MMYLYNQNIYLSFINTKLSIMTFEYDLMSYSTEFRNFQSILQHLTDICCFIEYFSK